MGVFGGRQEEPAILISRLLLRMRRMYVGLPLRMNGMRKTQFDHLSRETYGKHSVGAKAFRPLIIVVRTP